jgi:hypothetical protein
MIRTALPQLRHTPVGKRLETKMNELDGGGDTTQTDGDGHTPFHPSASTSPSASDVETSLTEDTGVTSSEADLYSPKSAISGAVVEVGGKSKSKQSQARVRENEELESLLQ